MHLMIKITDFEIVADYELRIVFNDRRQHNIDFEPVLYGHYYAPLRDLELFKQVEIDTEAGTLVWPNGADFDPATLYRWHEGDGAELAKRAKQWSIKTAEVTK